MLDKKNVLMKLNYNSPYIIHVKFISACFDGIIIFVFHSKNSFVIYNKERSMDGMDTKMIVMSQPRP